MKKKKESKPKLELDTEDRLVVKSDAIRVNKKKSTQKPLSSTCLLKTLQRLEANSQKQVWEDLDLSGQDMRGKTRGINKCDDTFHSIEDDPEKKPKKRKQVIRLAIKTKITTI
jgi:hypothetical protein